MEDLEDATQRLGVKDFQGLARLVVGGKVASIPAGTRVLITDTGYSWKRVRCEDGALSGQEYYVATEDINME